MVPFHILNTYAKLLASKSIPVDFSSNCSILLHLFNTKQQLNRKFDWVSSNKQKLLQQLNYLTAKDTTPGKIMTMNYFDIGLFHISNQVTIYKKI